LKTKPRQFLSDQEFFDAAWHWLITEHHPRCCNIIGDGLYRDGEMNCVVGAFIPEELYALNFPDDPITVLLKRYPEFQEWFKHLNPELMLEVEGVHNFWDESLATREKTMRDIAMRYSLACPDGTNRSETVGPDSAKQRYENL
jgi:hypothetical protein